ncbi:MAG: hypothetical protein QNK04_09880 [Myxococcota bacterium]|nr:hypothetical protein [Myxococcota bacterium]
MLARPCSCLALGSVSLGLAGLAALAGLVASAAEARALVATCEDGSIVLARDWADVRCRGAMEVEPDDLTLGVHHSRLPDVATLRRSHEAARERGLDEQLARLETRAADRPPAGIAAGEPSRRAARVPLGPTERRDLARAFRAGGAVAIARDAGNGTTLRLRIAYSSVVEERVRRHIATERPVLVFAIEPDGARFSGGLPSVAQGGVTFRPSLAEPDQGGRLDATGRGASRGYIVLPAGFDPARPLALFWGDAVVAARLAR